jgi:hypothetical protein
MNLVEGSRLFSLPADVIWLFVRKLDNDAKKSFRLTCKAARDSVDMYCQPLKGVESMYCFEIKRSRSPAGLSPPLHRSKGAAFHTLRGDDRKS